MANAEQAGARSRATFSEMTGPASRVSGISGIPNPSTLVSLSRLMPVGWLSHAEKKGEWPCVRAKAGHSRNHKKREASPHPHTEVDPGEADQMPHHTTTDTSR